VKRNDSVSKDKDHTVKNTTRIVCIGAGSISFGLNTLKDLFSTKAFVGSELVLVDTDPVNLDRMYRLAQLMNDKGGAGLRISKTTQRREALPGAGFVINAIAIERCRLWKLDFDIPKKYGVRHTLGENGGPGALFFTLRTIPVILDIVRDMEDLCPDAFFLNFSNPESRIVLALGRFSKIRSLGLCHGVFMGRHDVARVMGMEDAAVEVVGAGLNHIQWLLEVREKATGRDLRPLLREKEQSYRSDFEPLSRKLFRAFGYWPSCSDDHIGEYLPYGWEAGEKGYDFDGDERWRVASIASIEARLRGEAGVEEWLTPSGERAVDVIASILHNERKVIESGIVLNRGAIPSLPAECAVEVPIVTDASGVTPVRVDLPAPIARLLLAQTAVQNMAVEAAVYGSKEMALQALLIDPVMSTITGAEKLLEELWAANAPYIRRCI
jgi:alpha-galactosidase